MNKSIIVRRWVAALALLGCMGPGSAWGADQPNQTLDQVDAFDATKVLEMAFDRPPPPFSELGLDTQSGLAACKLASSGLYCLADSSGDQVVRQWVLPLAGPGGSPADRFSCADSALDLDGGTCTGLTVDISAAIWVAGQKGSVYSLIKLVKPATLPNGCTGSWVPLVGAQSTSLCAMEFAAGPGVLSDLDAIDGEVAYSSSAPNLIEPGILALNRSVSDASLYFDLYNPGLLHTFGNWNPQVGERLLSTTLLQRTQTVGQVTSVIGNYILAATTKGRILSIDFPNPSATPFATASPVFAIPQAQPPVTIDSSNFNSCVGLTTCTVGSATLSSSKSFHVKAPLFGFSGLGLNGSVPGEIAINENVHVQFQGSDPYTVTAIQVVYLFNGPEFGDKAEIARVTVDGITPYTLAVGNTADNAAATWSGPGSVTTCSPPTSSGAGCFLITNPFPAPVSTLDLAAVPGNPGFGGTNTNDSDFAIGKIEASVDYGYGIRTSFKTGRVYASDRNARNVRALVPGTGASYQLSQLPEPDGIRETTPTAPEGLTVAPGNSVDLSKCTTSTPCTAIPGAPGQPSSVTLDNVTLTSGSPTGVTVYQIRGLIDCRYAPKDCSELLGVAPIGTSPFDNNEYMEGLISQGIIIPLDPSKPSLAKNRYKPAAQLLNVTPMVPEDVTILFSESGGLPPLLISRTYRAQALNNFRFDALFYKTAEGQTFVDTFFSDIEVAQLSSTGLELGCQQGSSILYGDLRKFDVTTRVSESYRSVSDFYRVAANDYRDTIVNDGCGGTRTKPPALSLFPFNLEIAPDTYGPQSTSNTQSVTVKNDAVFARLVETLYDDLNRSRGQLACTTIDGGTSPPLSSVVCSDLASKWSTGKSLLNSCISAAFIGLSASTTTKCNAFRSQLVTTYGGALPVTASSADPANRLGGQKAQVATLTRLFDERFVPSIRSKGFCREKTAPNSYKGCPAPAFSP